MRLQGGISFDSPLISGIPQGTVLDPLLFIIHMCDINRGITSSSMVNFADDTRVHYGISNVDDCDIFQNIIIIYMSGLMVIIRFSISQSSNICV